MSALPADVQRLARLNPCHGPHRLLQLASGPLVAAFSVGHDRTGRGRSQERRVAGPNHERRARSRPISSRGLALQPSARTHQTWQGRAADRATSRRSHFSPLAFILRSTNNPACKFRCANRCVGNSTELGRRAPPSNPHQGGITSDGPTPRAGRNPYLGPLPRPLGGFGPPAPWAARLCKFRREV